MWYPAWNSESFSLGPAPDAECRMQDMKVRCGMQDSGYRMHDVECGIQNAGYRMQDTGCMPWDAGCGMQNRECMMKDTGYRMWNVGYRMHVVGCRMWDIGYRMHVVGCRMWDVGYRMHVAGCRMQNVGCRMHSSWGIVSFSIKPYKTLRLPLNIYMQNLLHCMFPFPFVQWPYNSSPMDTIAILGWPLSLSRVTCACTSSSRCMCDVNLHCQLNWVQNHLEDTALGVNMKVLQENSRKRGDPPWTRVAASSGLRSLTEWVHSASWLSIVWSAASYSGCHSKSHSAITPSPALNPQTMTKISSFP